MGKNQSQNHGFPSLPLPSHFKAGPLNSNPQVLNLTTISLLPSVAVPHIAAHHCTSAKSLKLKRSQTIRSGYPCHFSLDLVSCKSNFSLALFLFFPLPLSLGFLFQLLQRCRRKSTY